MITTHIFRFDTEDKSDLNIAFVVSQVNEFLYEHAIQKSDIVEYRTVESYYKSYTYDKRETQEKQISVYLSWWNENDETDDNKEDK